MLNLTFRLYNRLAGHTPKLLYVTINRLLYKTYFVKQYYLLNDLIWQDGFLIDFLQKKVVDKWVRKFFILSAYLFNERLLFDAIIKFYTNLVIWPGHKLMLFEFTNVASMLFITLWTLIVLFLLITLLCLSPLIM